jgi:hypothetical protein
MHHIVGEERKAGFNKEPARYLRQNETGEKIKNKKARIILLI